MNEHTKRQLLEYSGHERAESVSDQWPLNQHAPLLLSLKAVTHYMMYQLQYAVIRHEVANRDLHDS
jgi:hypothetical protein